MIEVSIIIAAYNVAPYIERAVNSALAQEGVTLEVVVVDDCSTDDTWAILSAITDPRVRIQRNTRNSGPGTTRNEAIVMAKGVWIAVLDGDDAFLPGRLEKCLARASSADVIVDNIEVRRESDGIAFPMFAPAEFSRNASIDLADFITSNSSFTKGYTLGYLKPIFRAEFLRQNNLAYAPALRIGEDYLLMAEILSKGGRCVVEPSIGYGYTVRVGSISHRLPLSDIDLMIEADETFLRHNTLTGSAISAQKRRIKNLERMRNFTYLVDALKRKDLRASCWSVLGDPVAALHLWQPLWARLKRL